MNDRFDIAIIGGGGSGLALVYALHLQGQLKGKRIAIIEPHQKDSNDRTWCFWTNGSDAAWQMFGSCASKTWSQFEGPFDGSRSLAPYRYVEIRSKDFYQFVNEALEAYPQISRIQAKVTKIKEADEPTVFLEGENQLRADLIFDSRPPRIEDPGLIWQSFVGYRIKTTTDLDSQTCRIMDFEVPQKNGLQFMYWLPSSRNEALVEFTRFGMELLEEDESKEEIDKFLEKLNVGDYEILEKEINKIPMTLKLNSTKRLHPEDTKHIPIGARAGAIKASSGFAFKYFCGHAWEISKALKREDRLPQLYRPWRFQFYDDLLMRLILRKESLIKDIFQRLFRKHPIDRIFRFLDEESSFREEFLIMFKSPWLPFFWSIKERITEKLRAKIYD